MLHDMHHLIPTIILVPLSFWYLARKRGATGAFYRLCFVPLLLLVLAFGADKSIGYGFTAHALFHFAYDTSYVLTLTGLILVLHSVFKRRRAVELALAVIVAVVPLLHLLRF